MRVLLSAVVVLVFAGFAAGEDKKAEKIDAKKLIGKWEPVEDGMKGRVVVEFFAEKGKVTFQYTEGKSTETHEAVYKVDGNRIEISKPDSKEATKTMIVSKLTDDELVGKDGEGRELTLKRVKPKK